MLVLISPTKTQKEHFKESQNDSLFFESKEQILKTLQSLSYDELKKDMKISDKITEALYYNLQNFKEENVAIYTYQGASFKPLEVDEWDTDYAQAHLGILSALYGLVLPFQTIGLYRLDFLVKFELNLYDIWQSQITNYLNQQNKTIVSLASQEYEKMILKEDLSVPMIRLDFKEEVDGKFISKSTYAKTARGNATNHIIKNKISDIEDLKQMTFDDYSFNPSLSTDTEFVFTR